MGSFLSDWLGIDIDLAPAIRAVPVVGNIYKVGEDIYNGDWDKIPQDIVSIGSGTLDTAGKVIGHSNDLANTVKEGMDFISGYNEAAANDPSGLLALAGSAAAGAFGGPAGSALASSIMTMYQNQFQAQQQRDLLTMQQAFQQQTQQQQQQFQQSEREATQQFQTQTWQDQMTLGPSLQMQGGIAAGISPNTVAGGVTYGGSIPSAANNAAPSGTVVNAPSPAPQFSVMENMANAVKAFSEAGLNRATESKVNQERRLLVIDENTRPLMNEAQLYELRGRLSVLQSEGRLNDAQVSQINELLPALKEKSYTEIDKMTNEVLNLAAERDNIRATYDKLLSEIATEKKKIALMSTQEREAYWNSEEAKSRIPLNQQEARLKELQGNLTSLDEEWTRSIRDYGLDPRSPNVVNAFTFFMENKDMLFEMLHDLKGNSKVFPKISDLPEDTDFSKIYDPKTGGSYQPPSNWRDWNHNSGGF